MSPFRLLVAAIITIAILALAVSFFQPKNEDITAKITESLEYAQANENTVYSIEIALPENFSLQAKNLDSAIRSVRFKCTSTETCGKQNMEIEIRGISTKKRMSTQMHYRCIELEELYDCVIYLGNKPAQLEGRLVSFPNEIMRGNTHTIAFEVKNIGALTAIDNNYTIETFYVQTDIEEKMIKTSEKKGAIENLEPERTQTIFETIKLDSAGKNLVRITLEGPEAGKNVIEYDAYVIDGIGENCIATETNRTYIFNGTCRTQLLCTGCESGYECAYRWREKGIENPVLGSKDIAYSEKEPNPDGTCMQ